MYFDLFILIVLVWALYTGWRNGFLKELASTGGLFLGLLIAALFYTTLGEYLSVTGSENNMITSIIAFFILWVMVPIVLGFVATLLTKALKGMRLGIPNSLLGVGVGLVKYFVLLTCIITAMRGIGILDEEKLADSRLAVPLMAVADFALDESVEGLKDATRPKPSGNTSVSPDSIPHVTPGDTVWVDVSRRRER